MGVMAMAVLLIVLVPLAILLGWAVAFDLKRRRRHALAVSVESRARDVRASAESKGAVDGG
jgi:hypothetical protein